MLTKNIVDSTQRPKMIIAILSSKDTSSVSTYACELDPLVIVKSNFHRGIGICQRPPDDRGMEWGRQNERYKDSIRTEQVSFHRSSIAVWAGISSN
ncbi:hypothetical protein Trydic_g20342 [Trypoxylus dichotomus]